MSTFCDAYRIRARGPLLRLTKKKKVRWWTSWTPQQLLLVLLRRRNILWATVLDQRDRRCLTKRSEGDAIKC
jgi:hypothetical protein